MAVRTRVTDRTYEPKPERKRIPVNLSLPADLVKELDDVAGPRRRSAFAEEALLRALKRERFRIAGEQTAGAWRGKGPAIWDEPGGVEHWVRELRREDTDLGSGG